MAVIGIVLREVAEAVDTEPNGDEEA